MDNPIKIVYKYKNDNRKTQYHYYIFVGPLVSPHIKKIFTKIQSMNFFDALVTLTDKEINLLISKYGNKWYTLFFLTDHISFSIKSIKDTVQKRTDIIDKFGREWYDEHIVKTVFIKKSEYSFGSIFEKTNYNKYKKNNKEEQDNDTGNNYCTHNLSQVNSLSGGFDDKDTSDEEDEETGTFSDLDIFDKKSEIEMDETFDIDEMASMAKPVDIELDKNPEKIKEMIDKALEKSIDDYSSKSKHIKFDKSKSNLVYDETIKHVYEKHFIYEYYIFHDDTIKTIKQKITMTIENNNKFSKTNPYIIPSRMYLWSEYDYFSNGLIKHDKIMLGQKWIKRSELLAIDIEPNPDFTIYEKLKGNIRLLNDSIKKYGSKIKHEDDENNILNEYEGYFTNNEIFMIDIYNELGANYSGSHDDIRNLYDVYCKIYFNKIEYSEFLKIIDFLSQIKDKMYAEETIISNVFQNISNDMIMEREITNTIESVKLENSDYKSLLKSNYVIQAVIHVNLSFHSGKEVVNKINLYRIFDSFITSIDYPFIQYQSNNDKYVYKFTQDNESLDKEAVASKWFEISPYGINFKIKVKGEDIKGGNNKFIAVTLFETGRLEYKSTWKEEDKATNDDVRSTYKYIINLIKKINSENKKVTISEPKDDDFRYAFINTIQHFEFPGNFSINHNDMSDFARYFYPYVAVVIEPKKRVSKKTQDNVKSKYGTYLRFKRISKFDNNAKIEHRIVYFLRNFEFVPKLLAFEISKQFNITEKEALVKIEEVVNKYPMLKKSRKILRKLQNIPKFKLPGIAVDIQGKKKENYKIRIDGARSSKQLHDIVEFITIFLWLYMDTYINKNPVRLEIKQKLKLLTNIAKRRHIVDEIVEQEVQEGNNIKEITKLDKNRLKSEKNDKQWPRTCQKSGDKNRRPDLYTDKTLDKMVKQGYKLNSKTGDYERIVSITKGKTKKDIKLVAGTFNNDNTQIHYTCSPEVNGEYMFLGFISKSSDSNVCVPCCYKKDPATSKNKYRRNFHLQCIGKQVNAETFDKDDVGDKLYILQDANKMLPGRFGYLYKYLDYYFNILLNKEKVIKNNYLVESETGYFMKFGSKQDTYPYLNAVSACLNIPYDEIIENIQSAIEDESLWTSLASGDIKTQFTSKQQYIDTIKNNVEIDHFYTDDVISIPDVIIPEGLNIYIFEKKETKSKIDFVLLCKNIENVIYYKDKMRKNIILIKEGLNYYPVMLIHKTNKSKNMSVVSVFSSEDEIIKHIQNYLNISCKAITFDNVLIKNAKYIYYTWFVRNNSNVPTSQYIDARNKCTYLIVNDKNVVPVKPSGCIYHLPITTTLPVESMETVMSFISSVQHLTEVSILGFIYREKTGDNYLIEALYVDNDINIPIIPTNLTESEMQKLIPDHVLHKKSLYDEIDEVIKNNKTTIPDSRIKTVNQRKFDDEHYELFRYEISNFLSVSVTVRNKIIKTLENKTENTKNEIKKILLKALDEDVFSKYFQSGGGKVTKIDNNVVNAENYNLNNNRELCSINKNKDDCDANLHCTWNKQCFFKITEDTLLEFISRITSELVDNDLKSKEILNVDEYYVLDVIDINNYTSRKGQRIVKSDNISINKILGEMFGKSNIPTIGKKRLFKTEKTLYEDNSKFPLEKIGSHYYQTIVDSNSLFRAYSNCIYWYKNSMSDNEYRNLGYYSDLQTELANTFKSFIYTFITVPKKMKELHKEFQKIFKIPYNVFIEEYRTRLFIDKDFYYLGIIDLMILNYQHKIPIVLLDYYDYVFLIIDNGIAFDGLTQENNTHINEKYMSDKSIKIKYKVLKANINIVPELIQSVY